MLTNEEQVMMNRLMETARKIDADFDAGRMSEEKYEEVHKLIDEAEEKMKAIAEENA